MRKNVWMCMLLLTSGLAVAQDADIKINGWGLLTFGRIGSGQSQWSAAEPDVDFSKEWLSDFQAGLKLTKEIDEATTARVHLGITTAFQLYDSKINGTGSNVEYQVRKFAPYIIEAGISHSFDIGSENKLLAEFGYLPMKYNPQAVNLGEYLVRSMAYPTVVESGFELSDKVKITGVHLNYNLNYGDKSVIKFDNFVYTNMTIYPTFDFSDAFVASVNHEKIIELGGGFELHNLISVNKNATTPGMDTTKAGRKYMMYVQSTKVPNPARPGFDTTLYDTTMYTTKATKLMGRICFNPLTLIGANDEGGLFGPEDFKIYAEAAVLGIKNYKGWYEKLSERLPVMFGMNLPGFKAVDLISFQLQYLKNPYWNTYELYLKETSLWPYTGSRVDKKDPYEFDTLTSLHKNGDDWKWSIYMAKTINKRMKFSLQFANDNLFKTNYMPPPPTVKKYTEIMGDTWMRERVQKINEDGTPAFDDDGNPIMILGKEKWGVVKDWYWMARVVFYL